MNPGRFTNNLVDTLEQKNEGIIFTGEDEQTLNNERNAKASYKGKNYLLYGFDTMDESLDLDDTFKYLQKYRLDENLLKQARESIARAAEQNNSYNPKKDSAHFCDFCGIEMKEGEYSILVDGRERCDKCSEASIKTLKQFKEIFLDVLKNIEKFFGIKLEKSIHVKMTNAKKIAKHFDKQFISTPRADARVLGFARKDFRGYTIYIENGSPKIATMATIAHELTHIWQYANWSNREIYAKYGKQKAHEIYEGMAIWTEIQYLLYIKENDFANRLQVINSTRDDDYGKGFLVYLEKYPFKDLKFRRTKSPFEKKTPI